MNFFYDLPKELEFLISNYEPKFILLCESLYSWHLLLGQNFGLEFSTLVPVRELRSLYIEKMFSTEIYILWLFTYIY